MPPPFNTSQQLHLAGYFCFFLVWAILPFMIVKDPLTLPKKIFMGTWYFGALLTLATYLVTR